MWAYMSLEAECGCMHTRPNAFLYAHKIHELPYPCKNMIYLRHWRYIQHPLLMQEYIAIPSVQALSHKYPDGVLTTLNVRSRLDSNRHCFHVVWNNDICLLRTLQVVVCFSCRMPALPPSCFPPLPRHSGPVLQTVLQKSLQATSRIFGPLPSLALFSDTFQHNGCGGSWRRTIRTWELLPQAFITHNNGKHTCKPPPFRISCLLSSIFASARSYSVFSPNFLIFPYSQPSLSGPSGSEETSGSWSSSPSSSSSSPPSAILALSTLSSGSEISICSALWVWSSSSSPDPLNRRRFLEPRTSPEASFVHMAEDWNRSLVWAQIFRDCASNSLELVWMQAICSRNAALEHFGNGRTQGFWHLTDLSEDGSDRSGRVRRIRPKARPLIGRSAVTVWQNFGAKNLGAKVVKKQP